MYNAFLDQFELFRCQQCYIKLGARDEAGLLEIELVEDVCYFLFIGHSVYVIVKYVLLVYVIMVVCVGIVELFDIHIISDVLLLISGVNEILLWIIKHTNLASLSYVLKGLLIFRKIIIRVVISLTLCAFVLIMWHLKIYILGLPINSVRGKSRFPIRRIIRLLL